MAVVFNHKILYVGSVNQQLTLVPVTDKPICMGVLSDRIRNCPGHKARAVRIGCVIGDLIAANCHNRPVGAGTDLHVFVSAKGIDRHLPLYIKPRTAGIPVHLCNGFAALRAV